MELSGLNLNVPPVAIPPVAIPGLSTTREAQYAKRIKELEDELRLMRVENEKNVSCHFHFATPRYRVSV